MINFILLSKNYKSAWLVFILACFSYIFVLQFFSFKEIADDAAFFMRYAENMLLGEFWVWNKGDGPIWGASAPLYPLLLAIPLFLGAESPEFVVFGTGIFLSCLSFSAMAGFLSYRFGTWVGIFFTLLIVSDPNLMYFSYIGLESPLTYMLLSVAVWSLLENKSVYIIGLIAGLLAIHKLDMIPVSILLLIAYAYQNKTLTLKSFIIAVVIALSWYTFAYYYFGFPAPNSFLTKILYQNDLPKIINWTWFGSLMFLKGNHLFLTILAIFSLKNNSFRPVFVLIGGMIVTHFIAYSIKYPFEPYNWYAVPSIYGLIFLAALGTFEIFKKMDNDRLKANFLTIGLFFLLIVFSQVYLHKKIVSINSFTNAMHDWAEAGRWVNKHTPADYRVYTMWGGPA